MHPRTRAAAAAAAVAFGLTVTAGAGATTVAQLQQRQTQQQRTIWRDQGTIRFFGHHARWLALTTAGRRALRFAVAQLAWTRRELAETRASLTARQQRRQLDAASTSAFACIHRYEGAWNDPGGPYYGGLQMDLAFQATYGHEYLHRWGTADHWPVWAQLAAAARARDSGRGYTPWPNSARVCGLL